VHPVTVTTVAGEVHVHVVIPAYPVGAVALGEATTVVQAVQTPDNE